MRALEFSDAPTFLDRSREFLFSREVEHNLLLSSALTLARSNAPRAQAVVFIAAIDSKNVTRGAALRSPNRRWIVSAPDSETAEFFGSEIARREPQARSLFVPTETNLNLLAKFIEESRLELEPSITQNLMRLDRTKKVEPAEGLMRFAQTKDLRKLVKWSHLFAKECGLDESPSEAEEVIRKYLQNKQLYVWEKGAEPLAMAAFGGITPKSVRLSMVYTDPMARARGYASTLVHRLTHKLLQEGHGSCVLFSDASNRSANKIYENIGYKTVAQFTELRALARAYKSPGNDLMAASSSR